MLTLLLCFIWGVLFSMFSVPPIVKMAHMKNLFDVPNSRTVHQLLTPRLGGLAIFAGFLSSLTIFGQLEADSQRLLAGCIILFFIGLKDDIEPVSAFKKFFVQILATSIIIFMGDIRITSLQGFLGVYELDEGLSYLFTAFVVIGLTNSINLIDGLDGLAGSIVVLASLALCFYFFYVNGFNYSSDAVLSVALCGSVIGFLRYNFHKALIFMGDSGSLICGFVLSFLVIKFIENGKEALTNTGNIALSVMFVPVFDTIRVFVLRIFSGRSPFTPDKNHIHHVLVNCGLNQIQTVLVIVALNLVVLLVGFFAKEFSVNWFVFTMLVLSLILSTLFYFLNKKG